MKIAGIKSYNSSPEDTFEAFCVQLFQQWLKRTMAPEISYFSVVNGVGGDGGVEAYAIKVDETVIGLQAKFFLKSLSSNQLGQIEKSAKTAKEVRPNLNRYIVCLPRKKFSARKGKDGKITLESEEKKVLSLAEKIKKDCDGLELDFWFEEQLLAELREPGNEGILRFWFEKEEISIDILRTRFNLAKTSWLRDRYVPDLHTAGKIEGLINRMLFTPEYVYKEIEKISEIHRDLIEAIEIITNYSGLNSYFPDINTRLDSIKNHLIVHAEASRN